jgi:hypothetical protein
MAFVTVSRFTIFRTLALILSAFVLLFFSCTPGMLQNAFAPAPTENPITALVPEPAEAAGAPTTDDAPTADQSPAVQLVLERGNRWIAGIPGFGANALQAFTGEYRIPGKTELVQLWLTRELLYFEGWTSRGISNYTVLQNSLYPQLTAIALGGIWTIVISLPPEMSQDEADRILAACAARFNNISTSVRDMSLPAMIPF